MYYYLYNAVGVLEVREDDNQVVPEGATELSLTDYADLCSGAAIVLNGQVVPAPIEPMRPLQPDWEQFITDAFHGCCAVVVGTPEEQLIEVSKRMDRYPSFVTAAQRGNLPLLHAVIARAHADYAITPSTGISPAMEEAIHAAMVANHLVAP